jgi:pimeloyl-ACP methyl ester carboxylesterase
MKNGIGLHPVAGTENPDRELDVLFIHGLGGDAFTTWQYENKAEYFWPKAMAKEFPDKIGVWTVAYGATPSKWVEDVMPMEDRAQNLLSHFSANGVGKRPFTLVAHSMGGLIAKYMLTDARFSSNPEYREIVNNCKGVVFLAVPHLGSGWSNLLDFARVFVRGNKIVRQLEKDSSSLRRLDGQFGELSEERGFLSHAFIETKEVRTTKKVLGFISIPKGIKIVSESSAGAVKVLGRPVPMDDDHLSICKLESPRDLLYLKMKGIIKEYLQLAAIEPASEKKKTEEVRRHRHWAYHTLAHDYFSHYAVSECFTNKNYYVGFYEGQRHDMPYSFAVDYCTKLKMPSMSEEIWEQVREVELEGAGESSLQKGLHKALIPDGYLKHESSELDEKVKARLSAEKVLVLNVQVSVKENTDTIINGAIEYLKHLNVTDAHIAVLFHYRECLKKVLPKSCGEMSALRYLVPDDIEKWLGSVERREIDIASLEKELSPLQKKPAYT